MNAKQNSLKALVLASALAVGGCASVPEGYTLVADGNDHVVWEAFGQPKLAKSPVFPAPAPKVATTTHEFPGHPIYGVWSAPAVAEQAPAQGGGTSKADIAFLRELARSDGDATIGPVETPSDTAVASR
jgi:hypothetical protein